MTVSDYPNTWPSINLDFRNSMQMDPRIPFTRASAGTTTGNATGDVNGEVVTFPENVPRLTSQGLLLEKERTNQVLQSQDFANAAWAKPQRTSVTANAGVAPDGTTTADLMFPNNLAGATCDAFQNFGNVNSNFAGSVYAQASGKDWLRMTGAQGNRNAWFNVNTGTLGTVDAGITASIEAVGNGWFRCWVAENNVTANFIFVTVCDADGSAAVTTNGTDGLLVWGGQFEQGNGPTSYIPTTTATVTRAADFIQVPIENFGNDFAVNGPGTFVCTASKTDYVGPSNQVIFTLDGRPMEPAFGSNAGQKANKLFSAGADSFIVPAAQSPIRETFVGSVQQTPAICNRAVGSGQSSSDTIGSFWPSTVNDWYIGNYLGNNTANPFNGWIERIAYYPVVMDLDQVEALAGL